MKKHTALPSSCGLVGLGAFIIVLFGSVLSVNSKTNLDPATGIQLLMFEQEGCHYCEVWDENIGGSYHKTSEGKFAPLKKVDIHTDDDVANVKPVIYTPTFVLYKKGKEVGRLTGYISDDFFWGMLAPMLQKHGYRDEALDRKATNLGLTERLN